MERPHVSISLRARCLVACVLAAACSVVPAFSASAQPELTDPNITNAIERELRIDDFVPAEEVNVETKDGVVTLTGQVDTYLAKERAATIATTVRGARAVVNNIAVVPSGGLSDADIEANVEQALLLDPATDSFEVASVVENGIVTLNGAVDTWQERSLAESVASGVAGVRGIDNEITVDYGTERRDADIQHDIEQALAWNGMVDDGLIEVAVSKGDVTLSGTVGSAAEKNEALSESWVAGVQSVSAKDLHVERWARDEEFRAHKYTAKSDDSIKHALEVALASDPRVMSFHVTPTVQDGVVTLRGSVDNLKAKRAATSVARRTVGVVDIKNELEVKPPLLSDNQDLESDVENALSRDPYVNAAALKVSVIEGEALLTGVVKSNYQKARADDTASRVPGIVSVKNQITVDATQTRLVYNPYVDRWYPYTYTEIERTPPASLEMTDDAIERAIRNQMWWSPFIDADDVTVNVSKGEARLTGTVESWSEFQAAQESAFEGGAVWVENELVIKPQ